MQGVSSCLVKKHSVFIKTIIGSTHSGNSDFFKWPSSRIEYCIFPFLLFRLNKLFQKFKEPHLHVHHLHRVGFVQVIHPSHDQLLSERSEHIKVNRLTVSCLSELSRAFKCCLRPGSDAVLHMSRIKFEFRPTQINLDRLN